MGSTKLVESRSNIATHKKKNIYFKYLIQKIYFKHLIQNIYFNRQQQTFTIKQKLRLSGHLIWDYNNCAADDMILPVLSNKLSILYLPCKN